MESFIIRIAGLNAEIHPMFLSTREYCKKYLSEANAEVSIRTSSDDLRHEQEMLDVEAVEEGLKRRKFTEPFLERTSIQRKIADELVKRNVLMVHGSAVSVNGAAYMFTASCGTGKSTHTRLWREVFGERAQMVNDDKPFLEIMTDAVIAHGSPWSGKHGLDTNISVPLKGICILRRGPENVIQPLKPKDAMEMLLHQAYLPARDYRKATELVEQMLRTVPLWEMTCTPNAEAARLSSRTMGAAGVDSV